MSAIEAGMSAQSDMRKDELAAGQAQQAGDPGKELVARENELDDRLQMQSHFDTAIQLTQQFYHLAPEIPVAPVSEPHGPGDSAYKAWAAGMIAEWKPGFYDGKEIYMKVAGSDETYHYIGGPITTDVSAAATYPNGTVVITPQAMKLAADTKNPGILAFYIHHEAHHFTELTGRGWDSAEAGEARTYRVSRDAMNTFEIADVYVDYYGSNIKFIDWINWIIKDQDNRLAAAKKLDNPNILHPLFPNSDRNDSNKLKLEGTGRGDAFQTDEQKLLTRITTLKKSVQIAKLGDAGIRQALSDIATKACTNAEPVTQEELDALPHPANLNSFIAVIPDEINSKCTNSVYMDSSIRLAHGSRLLVSDIISSIPSQAPAVQAEPPSPFLLPHMNMEVYNQQTTAYYEKQLRSMRYYVHWACDNDGTLSDDNMRAFRAAYQTLLDNQNRTSDPKVPLERRNFPGYGPQTALNGLSDCAWEVMNEFLSNPYNDLNDDDRNTLGKYHYQPPAPTPVAPPVQAPTPQPPYRGRRPTPPPSPCFIYQGVRFCPG